METLPYESMIDHSPMAFAYHRIILDEAGKPCDYEFLRINPAFEKMTGLTSAIIGKRVTEVLPGIRGEAFDYIAAYGAISLDGGIAEFEEYMEALGRWYRIQVYSPEKFCFVVNFLDVTKERKQVEEHVRLLRLLKENELQFHRIIDNLPFSLSIVALDGTIRYSNPLGFKLFELEETDLSNQTTLPIWIHPEDRLRFIEAVQQNGLIKDWEMHLRTMRGKELWAMGSAMMIDYQGEPCTLSTHHDITERKGMEEMLRESEEKYRLITDFASDVIWVFNYTQWAFTYISPSVYPLFGYHPEEAMQTNVDILVARESLEQIKQRFPQRLQALQSGTSMDEPYIAEIQNLHRDGHPIWVETSSKYRYNADGEVEIVGVARNIEECKRAEREILYLSYHDHLTGLHNRRFYELELQRLNTEEHLPVSFILADVNGLKLMNDAFGHMKGDQMLIRIASLLQRACRADDVIARIGGDEFVILLPHTDREEAERIIRCLEQTLAEEQNEFMIFSVSFGSATKDSVEQKMTDIFLEAENAMYTRKLRDSNQVHNETVGRILRTLYAKSPAEEAHNRQVSEISRTIAVAMELSEELVQETAAAALVHDIGKISLSDRVLFQAEPLTEEEWMEFRRHPERGYRILKSASEYASLAPIILCHHERMDGKGFPKGLSGEAIPLPSRILAVADAYDSMTSPRGNQTRFSPEEALEELRRNAGTRFDRDVVRTFAETVCKSIGANGKLR